MGNFETQRPSPAQLKSAVAIVAWLCRDLASSPRKSPATATGPRSNSCPGKDFNRYLEDDSFVNWVKQTLPASNRHPSPATRCRAGRRCS
jgi:hypothetical protein